MLGAEVFGERFDSLQTDESGQREELARCMAEPWYWVMNYVWTVRKDSGGSYVERVPCKEYLRMLFDDMFSYPRYAVGKSRQLMVTWLAMAFCVWWGMFRGNSTIYCQQKKEDDADVEMIQRCWHIYRSLPGWMQLYCRGKYSYCKLDFKDNGSLIKGIPSGGDQIRSHNPNILVSDEIAFQDDADESYTNALACCQRIILISTAGPGFFCDLVHDKVR